jgi:hypothetical protein
MTRGRRGRELAKFEFAAAILAIVATGFVFVAAPGFMGGGPPEWLTVGSWIVALAGVAVGLVWMIRIYRADPEPDQRAWRYRDRD